MNVHSSLNIPARMKVVNMTSNNGAMNTPSNPQNRHAKNRHNNVTSGGKPILFEAILGSDNCRWMMMIMYSVLIKIVNVKCTVKAKYIIQGIKTIPVPIKGRQSTIVVSSAIVKACYI